MQQEQLKVITYNVFIGFTNEAEEYMPAGEERKKLVSEWLAAAQPDIVASKDHVKNLKNGQPDYETMEKFKKAGLTDVQVQQRSKVTQLSRPRLDYIWASPKLAEKCTQAHWHTAEPFQRMSDHFPLSALFQTI